MSREPAPDPIAILLAEHAQAATRFTLFGDALALPASASREAVAQALEIAHETLAYLDGDLEVHIRKEEEPLFPRLKAALPAGDRLIDEMVAEHDQIRIKRAGLRQALEVLFGGADHDEVRQGREHLRAALVTADAAAPGAARLAAIRPAGRAVLQTLRVHFQNEEEFVFPLAPELLSVEELADAGREMAAIAAQPPRW